MYATCDLLSCKTSYDLNPHTGECMAMHSGAADDSAVSIAVLLSCCTKVHMNWDNRCTEKFFFSSEMYS